MWRAVAWLVLAALPATAEAPDASIFPKPRPATAALPAAETPDSTPDAPAAVLDAAAQAALDAVAAAAAEPASPEQSSGQTLAASPFPRPRPALASTATQASTAPDQTATSEAAPQESRGLFAGLFGAPRPRPDRTATTSEPSPRGNGICGNPTLTGTSVPSIGSRTNGCGVEDPVQITMVSGVALSIPATMDCTTANALAAWVDQGLRPAFEGTQVVGLQVAGHYICRTRNHRPGARISEHGRGKAIDISGIILGDGRVLTVAGNWNRQMRAAYQAGCGIFGTTLGPGSDGYHEDHMHFDTASHRNGPYCR